MLERVSRVGNLALDVGWTIPFELGNIIVHQCH